MAKKKKEKPEEEIVEEEENDEDIESKEEKIDMVVVEDTEEQKLKKLATHGILLFNRWSFEGVEVKDLSLKNYINLDPVIIPHSGGKHQHKKFWKTEHISVVERFINKIMTPGLVGKRIKGRGSSHNMGKKQKIIKMVYNAFALVEYKTGENPIQVLVSAIENAAPREETTRISLGGISYQQAVDIAPQRRVDLAIKLIVQGTVGLAYNNIKTIDELLANELILGARNDANSRSIKRKDEMERVAISAR
ncbi:30S ribosomal protein S7 [Candidatus Lokiarchaeum ossiferum]|uniref:30S ribosomal protein S7 n=1 Tax=Candidatus Lokiarchaeum ossiferum TaxID=2951803 RepID=A0ABY6HS41_9ARCH|nr:30S ribosomal protein S7 [Candidatus Lokiarchaeum sp. B-35]